MRTRPMPAAQRIGTSMDQSLEESTAAPPPSIRATETGRVTAGIERMGTPFAGTTFDRNGKMRTPTSPIDQIKWRAEAEARRNRAAPAHAAPRISVAFTKIIGLIVPPYVLSQ